MANYFGIPELTVQEIARKRARGEDFFLLDVREPPEIAAVALGPDAVVVPMSELAALGAGALPEALDNQDAEIVVFCHHGVRSLQVAAWLRQQGWTNVSNMTGGIDAYAIYVDPALGRY